MSTTKALPAVWTDDETGYACAIVVGPLGALNGYVGVADSHPWFQRGYSENLCEHHGCYDHTPDSVIDVHGGLTYAGGTVTDEQPKGLWWFGFDTAHAGDLVPGLSDGDGEYRDAEYVAAQIAHLAHQLAEVKS